MGGFSTSQVLMTLAFLFQQTAAAATKKGKVRFSYEIPQKKSGIKNWVREGDRVFFSAKDLTNRTLTKENFDLAKTLLLPAKIKIPEGETYCGRNACRIGSKGRFKNTQVIQIEDEEQQRIVKFEKAADEEGFSFLDMLKDRYKDEILSLKKSKDMKCGHDLPDLKEDLKWFEDLNLLSGSPLGNKLGWK